MKRIREIEISDIAPASDKIWLKPSSGGSELYVMLNGAWEKIVSSSTGEDLKSLIDQKISELVGGAPEELDTLKELADRSVEIQKTLDSVSEGLGSLACDGNATVTVGGISKGDDLAEFATIKDLLDQMLKPYVSISNFSVTTNLTGVRERGASHEITRFERKYTEGSRPVVSFKIFSDEARTKLVCESDGDNIYYKITGITDTRTYYASLSDGRSTLKASVTINCCDPCFYCTLSSNAKPSSTEVVNAKKRIEAKGAKEYTFECNTDYPMFAYPSEYGTLSSVKDKNGYEYLEDFSLYKMNLSVKSGSVSYYVYVYKKAVAESFWFRFEF